jgi:hypothetical protein
MVSSLTIASDGEAPRSRAAKMTGVVNEALSRSHRPSGIAEKAAAWLWTSAAVTSAREAPAAIIGALRIDLMLSLHRHLNRLCEVQPRMKRCA